jgi:hypothetical protein
LFLKANLPILSRKVGIEERVTFFIKRLNFPKVVGLVDEEEGYRMFGGYLPVERAQPKISSLKHRGNFVHKEREMHILIVMFQQV